ncbi:uncharacterized protein LOC122262341 [Penaeus japonicus]|uniref:uncharacterized protein LOC122262341 n=1 Tax=Penaeus japonicus TaxID=27405 RepID=UPI001C70C273|nr:uncharacterized protein LOC122262341 [Penaeus japonicus]
MLMLQIAQLFKAAVKGDIRNFKFHKALFLAKDQRGLTALHKASALGNLEEVKYILKREPSAIFARDYLEYTALYYAYFAADKLQTYQYLLDKGATPLNLLPLTL